MGTKDGKDHIDRFTWWHSASSHVALGRGRRTGVTLAYEKISRRAGPGESYFFFAGFFLAGFFLAGFVYELAALILPDFHALK